MWNQHTLLPNWISWDSWVVGMPHKTQWSGMAKWGQGLHCPRYHISRRCQHAPKWTRCEKWPSEEVCVNLAKASEGFLEHSDHLPDTPRKCFEHLALGRSVKIFVPQVPDPLAMPLTRHLLIFKTSKFTQNYETPTTCQRKRRQLLHIHRDNSSKVKMTPQ